MALIATVLPALGLHACWRLSRRISPWLLAHKRFGVVFFVIGFCILTGLALVPTYANSILGGWTFKFAVGVPAVFLGLLGSATISYLLARRIVGHRVANAIHEHPRWQIVRDALIGGSNLKVIGIIALIRLSPVLPFETTNVLLASCEVKLLPFLAGTMLGVAPRTLAIVFIASHAHKLEMGTPGGWWLLIAGVIATLAIITLTTVISRHALKRAVGAR